MTHRRFINDAGVILTAFCMLPPTLISKGSSSGAASRFRYARGVSLGGGNFGESGLMAAFERGVISTFRDNVDTQSSI